MALHLREVLGTIWRTTRAYRTPIVAGFGVVVLGSLSTVLTQGPSAENDQIGSGWFVPSPQPTALSSELEELLSTPLFGGDPYEAQANEEIPEPVEDPDALDNGEWRLIGIIIEGGMRSAVLLDVDAGEIEEFTTGSILPGGEILRQIGRNSIQVQRENEFIRLSLFEDKRNTTATVED